MAVRTEDLRGQLARHARTWRGRWQSWRRPHALYLSCPDAGSTPVDDAAAWQAPLDALDAWCAQHPGARCELALSSSATLWHVAPHGRADRSALATAWEEAFAQWAHYLDVDLAQPEVMAQWQLQEASADGFTLMAATPLALSAGLQDVAARHGVQLLWLGPWWVRGLASWLKQLPASAQADIDPSASLHLSEPGWAWAAQAEPLPQPASRLQRSWGRPAWRLTQLAWSPLDVAQPAMGLQGHGHTGKSPDGAGHRVGAAHPAAHGVSLTMPGDIANTANTAHGASPGCRPVDLAVLRGEAPIWSPT